MKCDELKSLWVYNRDINENCDEEFVNFAKENGYEELVEKKEVTEAIAELKDKCKMHDFFWEGCGFAKRGFKNTIAVSEAFDKLEAENAELKAELAEKDKDIAYWRKEYDEETKLTDALKAEIESLKASHYVEMVDAGMRERRLRRALWLARALRARDIQRWWIAVTCSPRTEVACRKWNNVERKCRAKAEEYK